MQGSARIEESWNSSYLELVRKKGVVMNPTKCGAMKQRYAAVEEKENGEEEEEEEEEEEAEVEVEVE